MMNTMITRTRKSSKCLQKSWHHRRNVLPDFLFPSGYRSSHLLANNKDDNDHQDFKSSKHTTPMFVTRSILTQSDPLILPNLPSSLLHSNYSKRHSLKSILTSDTNIRLFSSKTPTNSNNQQPIQQVQDPNKNDKNANISRKDQLKNAAAKGQTMAKKGAISIKDMILKHGFSFVGTYFTMWIVTLSSIFTALDSGLIDPSTLMNIDLPWHSGPDAVEQDAADAEEIHSAIDFVAKKMKEYKWTAPYADMVKDKPRISNFAIAFIATKFTEPVRIAVTLAIVPKISKWRGINVDDDDDVSSIGDVVPNRKDSGTGDKQDTEKVKN